eukprot:760291-Pelagomonas_calceolata.AAC.2
MCLHAALTRGTACVPFAQPFANTFHSRKQRTACDDEVAQHSIQLCGGAIADPVKPLILF